MPNIQKITLIFMLVCNGGVAQGTFTNLPNFPGSERFAATSFSIGNIVYYATGAEVSTSTDKNDLWSYDVGTGIWEQKRDMGAAPGRMLAASFALNGKGYVGTGKVNSGGSFNTAANFANDFYKYDPATNTWTQISNVGPTGRLGAVGFAVNGKGYIALGSTSGGVSSNIGASTKTIFELDPATDKWTQRPYPSNYQGFVSASVFVLNGKAYIAGGFTPGFEVGRQEQAAFSFSTYEFDPATFAWTVKAVMPESRYIAAAFSSLDRGYIVGGNSTGLSGFGIAWSVGPISNQVLKYNPVSNTWTMLSTTAPQSMSGNAASSVCENGFISTGAFRHPTNENRIANLRFSPEGDTDYIQTSSGSVCSTFDSQFKLQLSAAGTVNWTTSPNIYITSGQGTKMINVRSSSNGNAWVQASINLGCRVVTFPQKTIVVGTEFNAVNINSVSVSCVNNNARASLLFSPMFTKATKIDYYSKDLTNSSNPYILKNTNNVPNGGTGGELGLGAKNRWYSIKMVVTTPCGTLEAFYDVYAACSGGGGTLRVFPNPSSNLLTLDFAATSEAKLAEPEQAWQSVNTDFDAQLYFPFGKLASMGKSKNSKLTLDVSNLPDGLYVLKVNNQGETITRQISIKH